MKPPRRSLFWTIAGMFLLTVVIGTLLQALVAVAVLHPLEVREAKARSELTAASLSTDLASAPQEDETALDTLLERHRDLLGIRPILLVYRKSDGTVVTAPPGRTEFVAPLFGGPSPTRVSSGVGGRNGPVRFDVLARRRVTRGTDVLGEILVTQPIRPRGALEYFGSRTTLLFLPIAMLASVVAGLVMVRLLVRRLRSLEMLAARVTEGDLEVRISDTSGDEIGRLAERLDRMAERLLEAREALESTETQRRQLFADITHELATPLTSIRGYAETLLDPGVPMSPEERSRYLHWVLDESQRLDRLIRDLFDLARLEAGASPLVKEKLDWAALCRNTVERFEPRFREAGLRLAWRPEVREAWIEADGRRLEQVLENLLINALRYVPPGSSVELALDRPPDPDHRFRLTASDDGPGLPADELPLVFERFHRGTVGARDDGGSGLGLAIVREIVERHGGTVRARAREPHGLSIFVELPARD